MSLSPLQLLIILGIAVIVFGTAKFKNAGKDLGGAVKGFKDAVKDENDDHIKKSKTLDHNENVKADNGDGISVDDVKVKDTQV